MDDNEALELLDAHLDHEILTLEQAERLRAWLVERPEHADQAFRRMVVHGFLREGLQYAPLPAPVGEELRDEPNLEAQLLRGQLITIDVGKRADIDQKRRGLLLPWLFVVIMAISLCGAAGWFGFNAMFLPSGPPGGLWAYEGFDYPPTSPPAPLGDGNKWPTSGGMQGLSGGSGWSEPWNETAAKVSILIADVQANAWRASDMRKFGPLAYTDAQGHVLKSTGIQLRTAAGPTSATSRLLSISAFPSKLVDESGLGRDGAVLWISFLAQSFDGRGLGNFSYVQLGSDAAGFRVGKLGAVPSGNWSACGVLDNAETNVRWSDTPSGQPVLIVTRITFRPGDEEADIWINPRLEVEPETNAATLHVPLPDFRCNQLSIRSRYSTDFDEIRIGGSFRDVTPVR